MVFPSRPKLLLLYPSIYRKILFMALAHQGVNGVCFAPETEQQQVVVFMG